MWHYAITVEKSSDLERVQKVACKVILCSRYTDYQSALQTLNLDRLDERRTNLCLRFAKKCLRFEKTKDMFPLNTEHPVNSEYVENYKVKFASTGRLMDSAIPQLQKALNEDGKSKSN